MNRPLAFASLVLTFFAAPHALAGVPSPPNCVFDRVIIGSWDGNSAPSANVQCGAPSPGFEVIVRDVANVPVPGALVTLRFGASTARPHAVQNAGTLVNCPGVAISRRCDAAGYVRFDARVAGYDLGNNVIIDADGVILGAAPVISPDYDTNGAMTLNDFVVFSADFVNPVPQLRSDFNFCLPSTLPDYVWFTAQYLAGINQPPALLCP
jgi:hypothetical protein